VFLLTLAHEDNTISSQDMARFGGQVHGQSSVFIHPDHGGMVW
jgi:hypothetical protein